MNDPIASIMTIDKGKMELLRLEREWYRRANVEIPNWFTKRGRRAQTTYDLH